ncbi:MAG: S-adenosylmethionine synthetase N-terminal domain-containing protein [Sphaerochaetaceae bacterium]|nr:S-adenosylmethionine synthetase N-terminal domain-containing protein [Sphaerochaetaceae bacterium]
MAYEKTSPRHPDKMCDCIAGALVDMAYKKDPNPRIAVEVLLGHGKCHIISETSVTLNIEEIKTAVHRIVGHAVEVDYLEVPQDVHLSQNQNGKIRCGDNGIFKGVPVTKEQKQLAQIAKAIYDAYPYDGKYLLDKDRLIICHSNVDSNEIKKVFKHAEVNPIGDWTGSEEVDAGVTNRKLGSDMADSVTGGGLHGKDLSKADVSVNIYAFLKAQKTRKVVSLSCAIGDEFVDGIPYKEIVEIARNYIDSLGGFEAFAEWGLVRAK